MDKEEIKLYVKKSCENILKQLAENPKEMLDLLELQDKYNNLLKEKIELKRQIKKQKEVIDKANKKLNNFIGCCKAEKLESGNDYIHHQYWDMFERFNKQVKDILKEVE